MKYFLLNLAQRFFVWALYRSLRQTDGGHTNRLYLIIANEVSCVRDSIIHFADYQMSETEILTQRLGRRYDVGMAMNEATNRALKLKSELPTDPQPIRELTASQKMALKFQEEYLARIVKRQ